MGETGKVRLQAFHSLLSPRENTNQDSELAWHLETIAPLYFCVPPGDPLKYRCLSLPGSPQGRA